MALFQAPFCVLRNRYWRAFEGRWIRAYWKRRKVFVPKHGGREAIGMWKALGDNTLAISG